SYTFRYRKPRRRARQHSHPHYHSLQALSIRTGIVHLHGSLSLPKAETRVFLDIEGITDRDFYYLIGMVVESGESISHHYYWADAEEGQDAAFTEFVRFLATLPGCLVYHYGDFETAALRSLRRRLSSQDQEVLDKLMEKSINLVSILYRHVYFPTY